MDAVKKLKTQIETIMDRPPGAAPCFSFLESVLNQISKIYGGGVRGRNYLYDKNLIVSHDLPCFVISVGNITLGGTGKTPMVQYLARCTRRWGFNTAIITRGYGGKMEKKGGVVSDGKTLFVGPEMAGDEPYMLARTLNVPVIVGSDRYRSARMAIDRFAAQVLILDDGFQHRRLKRDLNLLLMDGQQPVGNGFLMPRGRLREPVSGAERSDWVVFTRSGVQQPQMLEAILPHIQDRPRFRAVHAPFLFKCHGLDGEPGDISGLKGRHVTLFSGIAMNSSVRASCQNSGMIVDGHLEFEDHHDYTAKDLEDIQSEFDKNRSHLVVTTHKDYTKLEADWPGHLPIAVLDVGIQFKNGDEGRFQAGLKKQLLDHFNPTL